MTGRGEETAPDVWDVIIVGQGLAGSALAWALHTRGQRVLVLDNDADASASKVAAGLITPITGPRLLMSKTFGEMFATAEAFYAACEARTGHTFFHRLSAVRLFQSETERHAWAARDLTEFANVLLAPQPAPLVDQDAITAPNDGIAMHTARLDTTAYLAASRSVLPSRPLTVDWSRDVAFAADLVHVQNLRTRRLISCEGFLAAQNPYLSWLPFRSTKGEILTVRFERQVAKHTLHRGIWLAPASEPHTFRVGATYDARTLNSAPTAAARAELETKLRAFVRIPYRVLDHQAAVRPVLIDIKPAIGLHARLPRLGYFNGLGSKGALLAPWLAERFADSLVHGAPLPAEGLSRAASFAARTV